MLNNFPCVTYSVLQILGPHTKVFQGTNFLLIHSFQSINYAQETLYGTDIKNTKTRKLDKIKTKNLEQTNQ